MDHWRNQRENQKITRDKWKLKHNDSKLMGFSKSSTKSEFYNNTILSQEIRKISNKIPNLTHKAIRERRTKNPKWIEEKKS